MPHYKLVVAYDGTRFHGFQRQLTNRDVALLSSGDDSGIPSDGHRVTAHDTPSSRADRPPKRPHWLASGQKKPCSQTIQQVLEEAIMSWTGITHVQDVSLLFASRTDKGVHSQGQVIAIQLPQRQSDEGRTDWEPYDMINAINSRLPWDISIQTAQPCPPSFDPRQNVRIKQYSYTIKYRRRVYRKAMDSHHKPGPELLPVCRLGPHSFRTALDGPCLWYVPWALDDAPQRMNQLCDFLQGEHDFSAFVHKEDRHAKSQTLVLQRMTYEILSESHHDGSGAPVVMGRFRCEAQGFRRSMVRNLVGFCVDVCRDHDGIRNWDWTELWTHPPAAAKRIHAAPASGLCLEFIEYHHE